MISSKTWHEWYKLALQCGLSPEKAAQAADKKVKEKSK